MSAIQDQLTDLKGQVTGMTTQVNQIPVLATQIQNLKEEFHSNGVHQSQ